MPQKIMLKADFSNAFNMVDRTEMLAQVYEKLPGLYRWVEYCYSTPAHLFFGSCLLLSEAGVQQGDPLGPLLFSLVLHPLALRIEADFPNLDLCVWYLDDGTIIGDVGDVHKVFLLVEKEGPALGLYLNVWAKQSKCGSLSCRGGQNRQCWCQAVGCSDREQGVHH